MIDAILNNKEWFFSGIGVLILGCLGKFLYKIMNKNNDKSIINQSQTTGDNSQAIQIGKIDNGNK